MLVTQDVPYCNTPLPERLEVDNAFGNDAIVTCAVGAWPARMTGSARAVTGSRAAEASSPWPGEVNRDSFHMVGAKDVSYRVLFALSNCGKRRSPTPQGDAKAVEGLRKGPKAPTNVDLPQRHLGCDEALCVTRIWGRRGRL